MADMTKTRRLSPRRNSTQAADIPALVAEQLAHFGIAAATPFGQKLARVATRLYEAHDDLDELWKVTLQTVDSLDRSDRVAYFNAKKFLSFQLAKLLDDLQNPSRRSYQSLGLRKAKGSWMKRPRTLPFAVIVAGQRGSRRLPSIAGANPRAATPSRPAAP